MAEKTFEQELADIENQLGNSAIPESEKAKLRVRKEEILAEIQEANKSPLQKQAEKMGAVQAQVTQPAKNYKPEIKTDEKPSMSKFGEFGQKLEDSFNQEDLTVSGDELEKQITGQSTAAQNQAIKPGEKAERRLAEEGKLPEETKQTITEDLGGAGGNASSAGETNSDDSDKDKASKKEYNQSMMSIWDAYHNGLIDKETAGYFTIDALATLAKNLGRSIGNVGAQFSGGTIDQGHDESMWDKRKDKIFNTELQKESEGIDTFENLLKGYQVDKAATVNDMLNDFRTKADDPNLSETERQYYQLLAVELAGAGLDGNTQIAAIGSGVWEDIKSKIDEWRNKGK